MAEVTYSYLVFGKVLTTAGRIIRCSLDELCDETIGALDALCTNSGGIILGKNYEWGFDSGKYLTSTWLVGGSYVKNEVSSDGRARTDIWTSDADSKITQGLLRRLSEFYGAEPSTAKQTTQSY